MIHTGIGDDLRAALSAAASADTLLLASDYDGCIAPIVSRPQDAAPNPASIAAIRAAADLPQTGAAVVSGRALADLSALSGLPVDGDVTLVGSHGSEFAGGFRQPVTAADQELLGRVVAAFDDIAARFPGVTVESKPVSAALHIRNASPEDAATALDLARSGPAGWPGVQVTEGKAVIELAVIETSKGHALDALRDQLGADAVIYLGDDVTDEKAFAHLSPGAGENGTADVGIKVGAGPTIAPYRIASPDEVAAVLEFVVTVRRVGNEQRA